MLWSQRPSLLWCSPAGAMQGTAWPRCGLGAAHEVFVGYLVCGGISFYPHARPGAGGVPTSSSDLRVQECQCRTLSPQLEFLASKTARRSATPAARCTTARRLSSGVTLVSPRGCRTEGLPMAKGGVVANLPDAALRQACSPGEHRRKVGA